MKKIRLLLAVAMLLITAMGMSQSIDIIPFHPISETLHIQNENFMQQRDGDLVSNMVVYEAVGNNMPTIIGNVLYKVARDGTAITDTLFIADSTPPFYLFAQNPIGEDNIRVGIIQEDGSSFLRISHFPDNDLNIDLSSDIVVPLYEGLAYDRPYSCFFEGSNKLVVRYSTDRPEGGWDWHFARFQLDGTLEHENIPSVPTLEGFDIFNEKSPRLYYQWGTKQDTMLVSNVLDEDFNFVETFYIHQDSLPDEDPDDNGHYHYAGFSSNLHCPNLIVDEDDLVLEAPYGFSIDTLAYIYDEQGNLLWTNDTATEYGLILSRYDKYTRQLKHYMLFNHDYNDPTVGGMECIGFHKTDNGCFYLAYVERVRTGGTRITAMKVDANFGVVWRRCCDLSDQPDLWFNTLETQPVLLRDDGNTNGMAVFGSSSRTGENNQTFLEGVFYLFINDDGSPYGMAESLLRPYAYYPNPVRDQLKLQYSPDVQPSQIELYDLQGRLVRTQRNGLESLNMEGLMPGQYVMKVTLTDGNVYMDKVVKE